MATLNGDRGTGTDDVADADGRCWFRRFSDEGACQQPGEFWWPDPPADYASCVRAMRWCQTHKHAQDVPISEVR